MEIDITFLFDVVIGTQDAATEAADVIDGRMELRRIARFLKGVAGAGSGLAFRAGPHPSPAAQMLARIAFARRAT